MSLYGYITPPELIQWVKDTASDAHVPLQEDVFLGTFLDSATLSKSRPGGLPTVPINLPRRYSHSPVETFMESDPGSHGGAHRRSTALRRRGRSTESEAGLPNAL